MYDTAGTNSSREPRFGIDGFSYPDLHDATRLQELLNIFDVELGANRPDVYRSWEEYRRKPDAPGEPAAVSDLLVQVAGELGRFIARLFGVEAEAERLRQETADADPVFRFKVDFVRRRVLPSLKKIEPAANAYTLDAEIHRIHELAFPEGVPDADPERITATAVVKLLDAERAWGDRGSEEDRARLAEFVEGLGGDPETAIPAAIESFRQWTAARLDDPLCEDWVSFGFPKNVEPFDLVEVERADPAMPDAMRGPSRHLRRRDGFALTDARMETREILSEIHYCVLCHERDKDSCSKGLRSADGAVKTNALDIPLAGCPLEERISEMHMLRKQGDVIGALAMIMISNPMCPGTGHRICNDCMKACIYQKQEPVNIPQIETAVLTDTLGLPWGVEIYGLLTRWNPLNVRRPSALPYNGKRILVVGLGPAGYTLAHHLLNEGFGVVAVDGLKIEPLDAALTGSPDTPPRPVRSWSDIYRPLDQRILEGFGGVSEYGITVRWDKNFLTLIHLTLRRRSLFRAYGGVRFGGTMTIDDAWAAGFDHIALAAGAGKPTLIDMKNNLSGGVRKASDFLMALQLTGAFKRSAMANLQVRLPAVVIGGGLTAIDTATELAAYHPVQVEKTLDRYEKLVAARGADAVRRVFDPWELEMLDEFLAHGAEVRAERRRAAATGEAPDFVKLVRSWGGVSIAYRKRMVDSPAYRLNHEEVNKALEEGISFLEGMTPEEAVVDDRNFVRSLRCRRGDESLELPARTVIVAAGTTPNIGYETEHKGTFRLDSRGRFFAAHRLAFDGGKPALEPADAAAPGAFFTSYESDGRLISFYGDNHPAYAGNVVKAMASARDAYPFVAALFHEELKDLDPAGQDSRNRSWRQFTEALDADLVPRVHSVQRLTPTIVEIVVHAPAAARHFEPGQFYRLQSYETGATWIDGTSLVMEGVALTGAWVDRERGLLSMIALELGVSSRLCSRLRPGEAVVVMGPTGTPTEIPATENVLLAGGGLGNAVLFSIAKALGRQGSRVLYFAGYKQGEDLFKREEIESGTDQVIWSTDSGAEIAPGREQDRHFRGNIVQAITAYGRGELGECRIPLSEVHRIIAIGSDRMMAAIQEARTGVLAGMLRPGHAGIGSINSPMQCMMKEICAQCLQKHRNPVTGEETVVFSCRNQDQPLEQVDFQNLRTRLRQNTVQEKLSNLWLERLLDLEGGSEPPDALLAGTADRADGRS